MTRLSRACRPSENERALLGLGVALPAQVPGLALGTRAESSCGSGRRSWFAKCECEYRMVEPCSNVTLERNQTRFRELVLVSPWPEMNADGYCFECPSWICAWPRALKIVVKFVEVSSQSLPLSICAFHRVILRHPFQRRHFMLDILVHEFKHLGWRTVCMRWSLADIAQADMWYLS